jgi:hypothetical protein
MADFLQAKTAAEVVERRWLAPVDDDDGAASVVVSGSGVTVDSSSLDGDTVVMVLSAGTAAETGAITVTVTTSRGRVLVETLYIPIVNSPAQIAATTSDVVNFALRKVVGVGETPTAAEAADALERLQTLVAEWREGGADIGAPFPLTLASVIYCPDWAIGPLKANLLVRVHDFYGVQPTMQEATQALRGLQLVKHYNLADVRDDVSYY